MHLDLLPTILLQEPIFRAVVAEDLDATDVPRHLLAPGFVEADALVEFEREERIGLLPAGGLLLDEAPHQGSRRLLEEIVVEAGRIGLCREDPGREQQASDGKQKSHSSPSLKRKAPDCSGAFLPHGLWGQRAARAGPGSRGNRARWAPFLS